MYTLAVTPERRYHLQSEDANRQLDALLEHLRVPANSWRLHAEMLTSALKMYEDGAEIMDLKITNSALKELRYGFKVFAPYRHVPKITVFGSARTAADHPVSRQAYDFGKRMTGAGWMVITGAGSGVMGAAQAGAGRERSFGLNIRLPFEQEANPWIADDPKLITFKYFFTRKLFLVREAHAMAFFPGGFGTCDEVFESLTLIQTGKAALVPIVLVDAPGGSYWGSFRDLLEREMVSSGMISPEDLSIFRITDDAEDAVAEIERFYRVFHSQRYVGDQLVFRLRRALEPALVAALGERFADILSGPATLVPGPLPAEGTEHAGLPRLVLPFTRTGFGRLRLLIDAINEADPRGPHPAPPTRLGPQAAGSLGLGALLDDLTGGADPGPEEDHAPRVAPERPGNELAGAAGGAELGVLAGLRLGGKPRDLRLHALKYSVSSAACGSRSWSCSPRT
jgi:uncharacterized protein (TIGR00730 family)